MDTFQRRTANIICDHRKRARQHRTEIDYGLEEFRQLVKATLANGYCPYCHTLLTECNFSADHAMPISRSGAHALRNLVICCQCCNETKGSLSQAEFTALMKFLQTQPPQAGANVLRRMRAGGRQMGGEGGSARQNSPPPDSLRAWMP